MTRLGVNIDHIATIRQARGTRYPDPIQAALLAEEAGADGITLHLREDRRHIQDRDVEMLKDILQTRMNLEMAATQEMLQIAQRVEPSDCCLVPEKREELTTEGGLDVAGQKRRRFNFQQVRFDERERKRVEEPCEIGGFETTIVVGVKAVDTGNHMPVGDKPFRESRTDESGSAGDETVHDRFLSKAGTRKER